MVALPEDVLRYFGDFRWWEQPGCLSSPECARLVPDLRAAIGELRDLFDEDTCRYLVANGCAGRVFPLFMKNWFVRNVDDLLQLGRDLSEYPDWRNNDHLVSELRSVPGFSGARFEVGVNAGLRRAGLTPVIEPAASRDLPRPDFVVPVDALLVGLELKQLADPDDDRNRDRLCRALADAMLPHLLRDWRGDISLHLSESAIASLDLQHDSFVAKVLPTAERELEAALSASTVETRIVLPSVGELLIVPRPEETGSEMGSYRVVPDVLDGDHLLRRALGRALDCSRQLAAANVDLRIALLWGSRSLLRAEWAAAAAQERIADDYATRWCRVPLDWIVFFNMHTLGPEPGVTTNLGLCRLPHARRDIPRAVLDGMVRWGRWLG